MEKAILNLYWLCVNYSILMHKFVVQSALQRLRAIEESIESERAAHLETKFNSEIVQVPLVILFDLLLENSNVMLGYVWKCIMYKTLLILCVKK